MYNQDRFLGRSTYVQGRSNGADGEARVFGRLSTDDVQNHVLPAMVKGLELGGNLQYVRSGVLGLASAADDSNRSQYEFLLKHFLTVSDFESIHRSAAVALGVLGGDTSAEVLREIAFDTKAGRQRLNDTEISTEMRAHAIFGLGMLGNGTDDMALRASLVTDLVGLLEDPDASSDLQVAAITALGLVPLPLDAAAQVCICGTCEVEGPQTSFQSQVTYLMRYFTADGEFDPTVRAHTATALGRLVEAGLRDARKDMLPHVEEIKAGVTDILIASLQRYAKQPEIVQESAVLALGLIGDSDGDLEDQWIRHELGRMAGHGDPLGKRYAMVALAEVGGRAGRGVEPWSGVAEARADLLQRLSRGKRGEKAWAGLALGILGHHLDGNQQPLDDAIDRALQSAARKAKKSEDLGAYALALGLRQHEDASGALVKKFAKTKDAAARGWVAMGLGLMGSEEALEEILEVLADEEAETVLLTRAGYAVGMLSDETGLAMISERIRDAATGTRQQAALATSLGLVGNTKAVAVLNELILDGDNLGEHRQQAMRALARLAHPGKPTWFATFTRGLNYHARTATLCADDGEGLLDRP